MPVDIKIREYHAQDLNYASRLFVEIFARPPWNEDWEFNWAEERISWIYTNPSFLGFVAEEKKKVVGVLLGNGVPFKGQMNFEIIELFISVEKQGQGIGKKLVFALEDKLREEGYKKITLLTAKNSATESFYHSINYERNENLVFLRHVL